VPSPFEVALGPVFARARDLVHEVSRAKEITERRCAQSVAHAGLEVKGHRAGCVLAARGLEEKNVDAGELRVAAAGVAN
jgi:hypothetical protein